MEIYVAILTGCAVIALIFFVLVSIRLWITCRVVEEFFLNLHEKSTPLLLNLEEASRNLTEVTASIRQQAEETEHRLEDTLDRLLSTVDNFIHSLQNWREKLLSFKTGSALLMPVVSKIFKKFMGNNKKDYSQEEVADNG